MIAVACRTAMFVHEVGREMARRRLLVSLRQAETP